MTTARTALDDTRSIENVPLLPVWVCEAVIGKCQGPFTAMAKTSANNAVMILLSSYPYGFKGDDDAKVAYMRRMESLFALYPEWAAGAVLKVGDGIASNSIFLPSEAELKAALEAELTRIRAYAVKARWHIEERERREFERQQNEALQSITAEQRAELVARLRPKVMSDLEVKNEGRAA